MGALLVSMAATIASAHKPMDKKADKKAMAKPATEMACQNNTCKGKADCHGFGNASCGGQNDCKGIGIVIAENKAECEKKHGVWTAKK